VALIKCKECGGEVSPKAKSCPHCDAKLNSNRIDWGAFSIVVLVLSVPFFSSMISTPSSPTSKFSLLPTLTQPDLTQAAQAPKAGEWVAVANTDDGVITVYANQSTIRKEGNIVNIWALDDFKKAEQLSSNKQLLSLKIQYEYDCKEEQMRRLYATMLSGNMGRGNVVDSSPIHEGWQLVQPDSLNERLWKFACGKK
jgi:hypothetical protein